MVQLIDNKKGASLVEYGTLAGLIAISAISVVGGFGQTIDDLFTRTATTITLPEGGGAAVSVTAEECYDPANIGIVGQSDWTGCQQMLIVDEAMLRKMAISGYEITTSDGTFTMANDGANIFTGQVTDMEFLFKETNFNGDIGYWDTSNVTRMEAMFHRNAAFNQDISGWDVTNVQRMGDLFNETVAFNRDISSWRPLSVVDMRYMFYEADSFNQDISTWDISSAQNIEGMFANTTAFNQDLSSWTIPEFMDVSLYSSIYHGAAAWALPKPTPPN